MESDNIQRADSDLELERRKLLDIADRYLSKDIQDAITTIDTFAAPKNEYHISVSSFGTSNAYSQ